MRYGATRYAVHRNLDDRYRITQMTWFENKDDWYRYWDGPEMIEFRRRNSGQFQIPVDYGWNEELAAGELGPEVPLAQSRSRPRSHSHRQRYEDSLEGRGRASARPYHFGPNAISGVTHVNQ